MMQPCITGNFFAAQVTFATPQRVSIALSIGDARDGAVLHLELITPSCADPRWHAERVRCDLGSVVNIEFLRDFYDALHWGLSRVDASVLTLEDLIAFVKQWEPTGR